MLEMKDGAVTLGLVALKIEADTLILLKLSVNGYNIKEKPNAEQLFILDSLVRSAASYGESLGAKLIETSFPDFYDLFKRMGFDVDEKHAYTKMDTIVKYG